MKPFTLAQTVILFCCLFLLRCSNLTSIAGATDMPNETASVSAVIHDRTGTPVSHATVIAVRYPNKPINYSGLGQNTCIGKHGNGKTGYDFYGKIDEARVYREAVSADYIKLCYMNQRKDDRLVGFK